MGYFDRSLFVVGVSVVLRTGRLHVPFRSGLCLCSYCPSFSGFVRRVADWNSARVTPVLIRFPSSKSLRRVVSIRVRVLRGDPRLGSIVRLLCLRGIREVPWSPLYGLMLS